MPKSFSDAEREYIKERLKKEAQECLAQYGMRKTTVDEIVRRARIPKGTFYLFYESKELLFFDVFMQLHEKIQAEVLEKIERLQGNVTAKSVTELIYSLYKEMVDSFLFRMAVDGELEMLFLKLPPQTLMQHNLQDDLSLQRIIEIVPGIKDKNIKAYSAAFRVVFASMKLRREIGEKEFDGALKIMIHGIVLQMFGER